MAEHPMLAVRGEAVLEVDPETARIEVSVAAVERDRAKALKLLNERAVAVDKVLAGFPDAIEKTETSGIRLSPQLAGRGLRDQAPRYHAAVYQTVTVTGFDRLGERMAQLADQEQTEVGGPWWELRPGSEVYGRVRVAAVKDAVRRARDYAAALGSDLNGLIELADVRLLSDSRGQGEALLTHASAPLPHRVRATAPEEFSMDLVPAKQVVRATVEARFTITEPDLAAVDAGSRRPRTPTRRRPRTTG
jgi:uncharacterized protein